MGFVKGHMYISETVIISGYDELEKPIMNLLLLEMTIAKLTTWFQSSRTKLQKDINYPKHVQYRRNIHKHGKTAKLSVLEGT